MMLNNKNETPGLGANLPRRTAFKFWFIFLISFVAITSCKNKKVPEGQLYFSSVSSSHSGIKFNNSLKENDSVNFLVNQYIYIGSGVGIADFNQDGLQDIFFAGAQVPSKLYINKGDMEFEDITEEAGLQKNK